MENSNKIKPSYQKKLRNIAVIAHVDHGKTTLVDAFLKQSNLFRKNQEEMSKEQILDSSELEREKGITITAKNASIYYKGYKINIIDTPGHTDFGGEVERTLNMADGCLLIVDASEGPQAQTKFVLKKALELKLKPIVVINKIDKKLANCARTLDKINDLFLSLACDTKQLDFSVFYAIGREGKVFKDLPEGDLTKPNSKEGNVSPLLDAIVSIVPAPRGDPVAPLQLQISSIEVDENLGKFLIGKIYNGTVKVSDSVLIINGTGSKNVLSRGKVKKVFIKEGLKFLEVSEASAGEIAAITGIESSVIGATICSTSDPKPLPTIKISPPAVKIKFEANTSPLVGKDGKYVTAKLIEQRLEREIETNITMKIEKADGGSYFVSGRGELQIAILIERLRREGYEFQIRKPEVIFKRENGKDFEPLEELSIDTPEKYFGTISANLSARNAELKNVETENNNTKLVYHILTRNLLGLRSHLLTATNGNVVMNNFLLDYVQVTAQGEIFRQGALISSHKGMARGYALNTIQGRGCLFITPGTEVYEGMIVGIHHYEKDLEVNPTRERHKSAHRMKHDEITQTKLKSVIPLTLEFALAFLAKDEILEVTPSHLRLRKAYLTKNERIWSRRKNLTEYAKQEMAKVRK